jgi:hypothetical protein
VEVVVLTKVRGPGRSAAGNVPAIPRRPSQNGALGFLPNFPQNQNDFTFIIVAQNKR